MYFPLKKRPTPTPLFTLEARHPPPPPSNADPRAAEGLRKRSELILLPETACTLRHLPPAGGPLQRQGSGWGGLSQLSQTVPPLEHYMVPTVTYTLLYVYPPGSWPDANQNKSDWCSWACGAEPQLFPRFFVLCPKWQKKRIFVTLTYYSGTKLNYFALLSCSLLCSVT